MAYKKTRSDYEYLETIIEVDDTIMFAADNVFELMQKPTKQLAEDMYHSGIEQWFTERHFDNTLRDKITIRQKNRIKGIAERHQVWDKPSF